MRRRGYVAGGVVAGVTVLCLLAVSASGDRRIYHAGTLSQAHRFIENDCARCHTTWGPVARLIRGEAAVGSVDEQRCVACHAAPEHFHNLSRPAGEQAAIEIHGHHEFRCATCHREHRGDASLSAVANATCVECHRDLNRVPDAPQRFSRHVIDLAAGESGHPEFALVRMLAESQTAAAARLGSTPELAKRLTWQPDRGRFGDRTQILFNHHKHLDPDGVLNEHGRFERLECGQCHVADAERRYMLPIQYEAHCRRCHGLYFEANPSRQVPHESPEVVRGFLTNHFLTTTVDSSSVPSAKQRETLTLTDAERTAIAESVLQVERRLQAGDRQAVGREQQPGDYLARWATKGGCAYCHTVQPAATPTEPFMVAPPDIPDRWLVFSEFRHDSHRELRCQECHYRQTGRGEATREGVDRSELTSDVLLPSIDDCRRCHAVSPKLSDRREVPHTHGASDRCVECHRYHQHSPQEFQGRDTIDEILHGRSLSSPSSKSSAPE